MPVSYSSRHPGPAAKFMGPIGADALVGGRAPVLRDAGTIPSDGPEMADFVERLCAEHAIGWRPFLRMAGLSETSMYDWRQRSTGANGGLRAVSIEKVRAAVARVRAGERPA